MTAPRIVDPGAVLGQALSDASPDLMRHLLGTVINSLLSAEADAVCGAEWGQPSPDRVNQRNGYRHRGLDTRVGTIGVAVPKLRTGTYFPEWLLERRKRAEAALISVVATCYLLGVLPGAWTSWFSRWGSRHCLGRRSLGWPPIWTPRSRRAAPDPCPRPGRSRSWPPTH